MGIDWTESASKWGIPRSDVVYAMNNAVYASDNVKMNDGDPGARRRVLIGPQHAQTDRLIEILIELRHGGFLIYHVMPLGSYYRKQMEEGR